jgi:hypothetical protein
MPFKDKPSTNPRYEALYKILGRVNDKLRTNDVVVTVHNDSSDDDIVKRVNSTDENVDEQLLDKLRKGNGGDREVMDVSNHEASSSSEAPAVAGHRITRSKSRG